MGNPLKLSIRSSLRKLQKASNFLNYPLEPDSPLLGYGVHTSRITPLNPPDILGGKRNLSSLVPSPL